jgi:hypothetical protein
LCYLLSDDEALGCPRGTFMQIPSGHPDFHTPSSLDEAHARRLQLINDVQNIAWQLSSTEKRGSDGLKMAPAAYAEWRRKAIGAMRLKEAALRAVKKWIHDAKAPKPRVLPSREPVDGLEDRLEEAEGLLREALTVFQVAVRENIVFRDDEKRVFGKIEVFLADEDGQEEAKVG